MDVGGGVCVCVSVCVCVCGCVCVCMFVCMFVCMCECELVGGSGVHGNDVLSLDRRTVACRRLQ